MKPEGQSSLNGIIRGKRLWFFASVFFSAAFVFSVLFFCYEVYHRAGKTGAGGPSAELKSLSMKLGGTEAGDGEEEEAAEAENTVRRRLDGVYVGAGEENRYPAAVMIDNNVYARPPSALSRANLVYEAEVEGGATRFMALFSAYEAIEEIGPVRSARPYFIDWAREYSSLYVHCGGSPEALARLAKEDISDLNEFYQGAYFWRDENRYPPHNVYTSGEMIRGFLEKKGLAGGDFGDWQFKEDAAEEKRPDGGVIRIKFRLPEYAAGWKYDKPGNGYMRYVGGKAHIDRSGQGIVAKNVVIQYAAAEVIDEELRLKINTVGKGDALVCLDGACREAEWRKEGVSDRTRFFGENDEELQFNAGPTWIEIVRPEYEVEFEK